MQTKIIMKVVRTPFWPHFGNLIDYATLLTIVIYRESDVL